MIAGHAETVDVDEVVARFTDLGKRLQPYVTDTVTLLHDATAAGDHVLLKEPRRCSSTSTTAATHTSGRPT